MTESELRRDAQTNKDKLNGNFFSLVGKRAKVKSALSTIIFNLQIRKRRGNFGLMRSQMRKTF